MAPPTPQPLPVDALLLDGAVVAIRPIAPADEPGLLDLYRNASTAALRSRFFTASPYVIDEEIRRLIRPPDAHHVAVAAVDRGRVLGVGLWERTGATSVEFALMVRDNLHGHGVGTLLLEHLLAAARDIGMTTVTASVLADNSAMLGILRDLGMTRRTQLDSGIVEVELTLSDTPAWRAAVGARESLAEHASLRRILQARCIAVIGAGRDPLSPGHRVLAALRAGGFDGGLHAVNLTGAPVLDVPAATKVSDLGEQVDVAVVAVPAASVLEVVADCAAAGVYGVVVISDGFAETGAEGAERQRALQRLVRDAGMRLIGPNCLGFIYAGDGVRTDAVFADVRPPAGSVGLVSQSGGVGIALLDYVAGHGLGISSFVSVGNKADVSGNDLLMYWQHNDATKVCALYLESFGNARKFARVARTVARTKPVVAVTAGRSVAGARGTRSHTAAASTPDVAIDALFRQAGVIRAASLSEMLDVVGLLDRAPMPAGRRVAVVSNAGGPAALAADACAAAGLDLPALSPGAQDKLRALLRRPGATANPVDTTAQASAAELVSACSLLLDSGEVDAVVLVHTALRVGDADELRPLLRGVADARPARPLVAVFLGAATLAAADGGVGVPAFAFPEAAATALASAARYAEWRAVPEEEPPTLAGIDLASARAIVGDALTTDPGGRWLDTDAAADLVASYGVPVVPTRRVDTLDQAVEAARAVGLPVAVKTAAGDVVHRRDVGGVRIGLRTAKEVRAAARSIREAVGRRSPLVVQPMAGAGVETAVGITLDPTIGPLLMVALGGVATDLLADRAFRLVPVGRTQAAELVRSLRAAPLLFGYRGAPACDVDAFEDVVMRVSRMAADLPEIAELDINPLVVRSDGAVAVDVKVRVAPVHDPDPYLRRLSLVTR